MYENEAPQACAIGLVQIRNPYNYDRDAVSRATGLECRDESLTIQEGAEETNINYILEQFGKTGLLPVTASEALQGDFTDVGDYRSMLDQLKAADEAFKALPANVRRFFDDDPAKFTSFMAEDGHQEQLREWGLLNPPEEPPVKIKDVVDALNKLQPQNPNP